MQHGDCLQLAIDDEVAERVLKVAYQFRVVMLIAWGGYRSASHMRFQGDFDILLYV